MSLASRLLDKIKDRATRFVGNLLGRTQVGQPVEIGVLSNADARRRSAELAADFKRRGQALTDQLINGEISAAQWKSAMQTEIRITHTAQEVLGAGGWANMGESNTLGIDQAVQRELIYFERFYNDVVAGKVSDKRILARVGLYGEAGGETFSAAATRGLGFTLPFQPKQRTDCGRNCYCRWEIINVAGEGNYDCVWVLDRDRENCETCIVRARVCKPLKVRAYKIMTDLSNPLLYSKRW